jgi:hypothetical protein
VRYAFLGVERIEMVSGGFVVTIDSGCAVDHRFGEKMVGHDAPPASLKSPTVPLKPQALQTASLWASQS